MATPHHTHFLVKPVGPICNLDCKYCFYLDKRQLYPGKSEAPVDWRMDGALLESCIQQVAQTQPGELHFAWQGGEPTLAGLDFFRQVVRLQQRHCGGRPVFNGLQTNGLTLDDEWCQFLANHGFLVGLSVDGPADLHDCWRLDRGQRGSHQQVQRALVLLRKHGVEFNTLTVVHRQSVARALEIYEYLISEGSRVMQFLPLVEPGQPWSLEGPDWADFLCPIFDLWSQRDVGQVFVQLFEVALENWLGQPASLCFFRKQCGQAVALEHNGDLFSCDHFVEPAHQLGNLQTHQLQWMLASPQQKQFGRNKSERLPGQCQRCKVLFACHGECPKNRLLKDENGEPGLNFLCAGYLRFFGHIQAWMEAAVQKIRSQSNLGLPPLGDRLRSASAAAGFLARPADS
ncbi:anaerobic sulfatase maturase [bacterium]|nr:anaerobic sulfatase maturase [bacterium]